MSRLTKLQKNGITNMVCKNEDCHTAETYCPCTITDQCDCQTLKAVIEKLAYYEDLEEQGRLIELPCKVGDTVYALENVFDDGKDCSTAYIAAYELFEITYDGENLSFSGESYTFGENVFTTKEEAEAKLKELKGE